MRSKELLVSAQRTGVEPDPGAAREFRLAAVQLAKHLPDTEGWRDAGSSAARALVSLALADADDVMRVLLTPDPRLADLTWTVACYQIGDLTPSALRDFPDPIEAVATLAACPEDSHVAAELVVSASTGLRWTAMTRTNEVVTFQLPTTDTASDGSGEHPGDLAVALRRWREQVARWDEIGDGTDHEVERAIEPRRESMGVAVSPSNGRVENVAPRVDHRLDQRLSVLEDRLSGIEGALSAMTAAFEGAMGSMLSRDDRIRALEADVRGASLESVRHEAEFRTQTADQLEQVIDVRFRAMASYLAQTLGRLDLHIEAETNANRLAADEAVLQLRRVEPAVSDAVTSGIARFDDRLARLERSLDLRDGDTAGVLAEALESTVGQRVELIEERIMQVARSAGVGVSDEVRSVADAVSAVARAIVARDEVTGEALARVPAQVEEVVQQLGTALRTRAAATEQAVSRVRVDVEGTVDRLATDLSVRLDGAVEAIDRRSSDLAVRVDGAVEKVDRRSADLTQSVEGAVDRLATDLAERVDGAVDRLAADLTASVAAAATDIEARVRSELVGSRTSMERSLQREAVAIRAAAETNARREGAENRTAVDQVRRDLEDLRAATDGQHALVAERLGAMGDALRRSAETMSALRVSVDTNVLSQRGELLSAVHDVEAVLSHVEAISETVHASLLGVEPTE